MDPRQIGLMLMLIGAALAAGGWLIASGWLSWFGRLPGDIRIVSDSTRVYIPITSMLLVSVVLSVLLGVFRRLL
jgi:hypothetical protein